MKRNASVALCGLMALVGGSLWFLPFGLAQDRPSASVFPEAPFTPAVEGEAPRPARAIPAPPGAAGFGQRGVKVVVGGPNAMQEIRGAAEALSEAKDDDAKAEAEEKLTKLLDEYFEEDMKRREEELADVEARVKKLRELMERRREKKGDIINLQKDVLVNEAAGLGFFNGGAPEGAGLPPGHPYVGHEGGTLFKVGPPPTPGAAVDGNRTFFFTNESPRPGEKKKRPKDEGNKPR